MNVSDLIREMLPETCSIGQKVLFFDEIDSTNRLAKELAGNNEPHGTVLIADRQTAGRGRLGKSFYSPDGGLYMSVILRPTEQISDMMALTACTAAAIHTALSEFDITTKIKWVNDLFLNDRKICGILCEGGFHPQSGGLDYLIIGIGLNLTRNADVPQELRSIITDIETETGLLIDRNSMAAAILKQLAFQLSNLSERSFLSTYTEHSYTLGKTVIVTHEGMEKTAEAIGFTQDLGLIVRFSDGTEAVITSGTARFPQDMP